MANTFPMIIVVCLLMSTLAPADTPPSSSPRPFRIQVVDSQTGRGVPLIELTTVNGISFVTDSAGLIAFDEPGLMNSEVFFAIKGHGYSYPKDGFDQTGVRLRTTPGGSATVKVDRVNIAQRLYRITGQGIYRDSILLGDKPPTSQPVLCGGVLGQDSIQRAIYRSKIYWFWGDTARASYPLGNFSMSGATSELPPVADGSAGASPSQGVGGSAGASPSRKKYGLDPAVGIDLTYFVGADGFSRGMCPIDGQPGPVWCDGMTTVTDNACRERLLCHFARMKSLGEMHEQGIALYNDDKEVFESVKRIPLDAVLHLRGNPVRHKDADGDYYYFASPFPLARCRADYDALLDPAKYEAYTCLKPGARYGATEDRVHREKGRLIYGWKADTGLVLQKEQDELIAKGLMKRDEALIRLRDAETDKPVLGHAGTVAWNNFRKKWIMIVQEGWGSSMCGEIWYAEAPALVGPWGRARKIITHDDYSFYNVAHHPFFDQDGGRTIYLEGTYTMAFSGTKRPTPRYDYNQIMYSLDLSDPRLRMKED